MYNIEFGKVSISRDVLFNEEACWDWSAQEERSISIPLVEMSIEKERKTCESSLAQAVISEMHDMTSGSSKESQIEINATGQSGGPSSQDFDHTPLKYKSIAEVYENCNLCIVEPETFENAAKDEAWLRAMEN